MRYRMVVCPVKPAAGSNRTWVPVRIQVPFPGTTTRLAHFPVPACAIASQTGAASQVGRIGASLSGIESTRTPLQREIDRIVRVVAIAGIATSMAMLPEEFGVVLTVFLALGAWRMSRTRVLARTSAVIETLGSATVVCVDKTGTLTANAMRVNELIVDGQVQQVVATPVDLRTSTPAVADLVRARVLASPADAFDPMDRACSDLAAHEAVAVGAPGRLIREYPLTDDLLAIGQGWWWPQDDRVDGAVKGAPEAVADLCALDPVSRVRMDQQVRDATRDGQRVLAVAMARHVGAPPDDLRSLRPEFLGLVALEDPLRPGVRSAVDPSSLICPPTSWRPAFGRSMSSPGWSPSRSCS